METNILLLISYIAIRVDLVMKPAASRKLRDAAEVERRRTKEVHMTPVFRRKTSVNWGLSPKPKYASSESDCSPRTVRFVIPGHPIGSSDHEEEEETGDEEALQRKLASFSSLKAIPIQSSTRLILSQDICCIEAYHRSEHVHRDNEWTFLATIAVAVALAILVLHIGNLLSELQRRLG